MIISASRRTDIPACYSDWFYQRIKEGYVLTRNPMRFHQVSKVNLSSEAVDGIVFWTKNPEPMMDRLNELNAYTYYFQFTLTSYGKDIEPNVPIKSSEVIPTFQRLSDKIGPEKVIWRYDPILLSNKYTLDYHMEFFHEIARRLKGYTNKCIISFVDRYKNTDRNSGALGLAEIENDTKRKLAETLSQTACSFGMLMDTCAEEIDLSAYGIGHAKCIDGNLLGMLRGYPIKISKDKNQRPNCGCDASVDIGVYNTCKNGCKYCYANYNTSALKIAANSHDPLSPLLIGNMDKEDIIKERT
jgi:DNA repair photolyase